MTSTTKRKRLVATGAVALLVAGISTGGALVTTQSTIFDNVFKTEAEDKDAIDLRVTGSPMSASYTGSLDNEVESAYFTVENLSTTKNAKFDLNTRVQPNGNKAGQLAAALSTSVGHSGKTVGTGTLANMAIPTGDQITLAPGEKKAIRVDVFVKDSAAFLGLGLGDDAEVNVDFLFDSIFSA